jgi:uncharacterized protein (DUF433 family)
MVDFQNHIERNPRIARGVPVVKRTRIPIRTVLASLAEGASMDEILADLPTLTWADVQAVVAFAATSAMEDLPVGQVPVLA